MLLLVKAIAQTRKITHKSISSVEGQQVILIVLQMKKKNQNKTRKQMFPDHSFLPTCTGTNVSNIPVLSIFPSERHYHYCTEQRYDATSLLKIMWTGDFFIFLLNLNKVRCNVYKHSLHNLNYSKHSHGPLLSRFLNAFFPSLPVYFS